MLQRWALALAVGLALLCSHAWAAIDAKWLTQLAGDDSDQKIEAVEKLAASADPFALRILKALMEDRLFSAGEKVLVQEGSAFIDAQTGAKLEPAPDNPDQITINNRIRRELESAIAGLKLYAPERATRLAAARELSGNADENSLPVIEKALAAEKDAEILALLKLTQAKINLASKDNAVRLAAVQALAGSDSPQVKRLLSAMLEKKDGQFVEPDQSIRVAAEIAARDIDSRLFRAESIGRVFSGISLGSILLLAAIGLAITYGVMGVINMAHGELLMIGAYATFAVQSVFRAYLPNHLDWYLAAAVPVAFVCAALVGVVMERLVIRHLYGRPLESLLATWGLSLFLIQCSRSLFGAQNVEVANPRWMSGGVEVMTNVVLPWNRIIIIAFSLAVLLVVWLLMNRTRTGLYVRAVTQNRAMAGCIGVRTPMVDTSAFALGAGIAGLGGCALSQISNVGPDMGQGYIVDSFMVVVLGGVGQLAGAVWAALGLGVVSKFLEGFTGAVIAKILVLVFIIIFIQKRPQGLFAVKGRFVEN